MKKMNGKVGDIFWSGQPTISEPVIIGHKIAKVSLAFTPADSECEEYAAVCGITAQNWFSLAMGIAQTSFVENEDERPAGVNLCLICFPGRGTEESKTKELKCPECGSDSAGCFVEAADGAEYYDKYTLLCEKCGYTVSETKKAGSPFYGNDSGSTCPYCGNSHVQRTGKEGKMRQMSIEEAIDRAPGMSPGRYRDAKIIEEKCPKCGNRIVCVYDDLGAVDFYDNYAHICLNPDCAFILHQESFSCNMGGRGCQVSGTCLYCGRLIQITG